MQEASLPPSPPDSKLIKLGPIPMHDTAWPVVQNKQQGLSGPLYIPIVGLLLPDLTVLFLSGFLKGQCTKELIKFKEVIEPNVYSINYSFVKVIGYNPEGCFRRHDGATLSQS